VEASSRSQAREAFSYHLLKGVEVMVLSYLQVELRVVLQVVGVVSCHLLEEVRFCH
jgi:hypothetical protein